MPDRSERSSIAVWPAIIAQLFLLLNVNQRLLIAQLRLLEIAYFFGTGLPLFYDCYSLVYVVHVAADCPWRLFVVEFVALISVASEDDFARWGFDYFLRRND